MVLIDNFFDYKGNKGMSIAMSCPKWFKGPCYKPLMPPWSLISAYKSGQINSARYTEIYKKDVLSKLDKNIVKRELEGYVLLRWEKGTGFCHRYLVKEWLEGS